MKMSHVTAILCLVLGCLTVPVAAQAQSTYVQAGVAVRAGGQVRHRAPVTQQELEILARRADDILGEAPDGKVPLHKFMQGPNRAGPPKPGCVFVKKVPDPQVRGLWHTQWDCSQARGVRMAPIVRAP